MPTQIRTGDIANLSITLALLASQSVDDSKIKSDAAISTSKLAAATETPGNSKIVVSNGSGKLASGWGGGNSSLATTDGSGFLVETAQKIKSGGDPASQAGAISINGTSLKYYDGAALRQALDLTMGNSANGYAALDGSSVANPTNIPTLNAVRAPVASVSMNNQRITNVLTDGGSASTDAVSKGYADGLFQGAVIKPTALAIAAVALTETYEEVDNKTLRRTTNGAFQSVDGQAPQLNGIYLLTAEANAWVNGWYILTAAGGAGAKWVLSRIPEADEAKELQPGSMGWVAVGTNHSNSRWAVIQGPQTLGATDGTGNIVFTQLGGPLSTEAGLGLVPGANGTLDVNTGAGLAISGDQVVVPTNGIATAMIQANAITAAKIAANVVDVGQLVQTGMGQFLIGQGGGSNQQAHGIAGDVSVDGAGNSTIGATKVLHGMLATAVSSRLGAFDRREDFTAAGGAADFITSQTDVAAVGFEQVYKNGLLMTGGGADYTWNQGAHKATFVSAPLAGEMITIFYKRTGSVG